MLPGRSAEREAFEEAGGLGRLAREPIGSYRQGDHIPDMLEDGVIVGAFALEVVDELSEWREMHSRERRWFSLKDALRVVRDPEIRSILQTFKRSMKR
jgi:8-oxo-dGTP pyrophosphatase MutT (NUDIX family)